MVVLNRIMLCQLNVMQNFNDSSSIHYTLYTLNFNFYTKIILYNNHIFAITLKLGLFEVPFHVIEHVACLRRHLAQEKKKKTLLKEY